MTSETTSPSTLTSPTATIVSSLLHTPNDLNGPTLPSPTGTKRKSVWEGVDLKSDPVSRSNQPRNTKQSKGRISEVIARRKRTNPAGGPSKAQGEDIAETQGSGHQDTKRRRIDPTVKEEKKAKHARRTKLKALMRNPEDPAKLVTALEDSRREVQRLKDEVQAMKENEKAVGLVLDGFEEELKCGICQESFIDPVTVQPCGHSYCGACMANYIKSYKIKDKLVWTWPGHKSNVLEASYAQRKRNGETSLTTKVYTVNIPPPTPPVKYNQWGEAYYSASESDSEAEPAAATTRAANGNAAAERNGFYHYEESEAYSSDEDDYDGSHVGTDDEDEGDGVNEEGPNSNEGEDIPADELPVPVEVSGTMPIIATDAAGIPVTETSGDIPAPDINSQTVEPEHSNSGNPAEVTDEVHTPIVMPSTTPTSISTLPASSETVPQPAPMASGVMAPEVTTGIPAPPEPLILPANGMPIHGPPVVQPPIPTATPEVLTLGEGKLSSKGLSCMFCRRTPITGIVPALALGAAAELLIRVRPETAREQEAIEDHHKNYEKGQPLSVPIPPSAVPSFTAVMKAPQEHVYMYRESSNTRYWKPCAFCKPPAAGSTRFVCPVPVPDPNHRSTRLSRDLPCPGHVVCGNCERLSPETKARYCDGCSDSRCRNCDLPHLAYHYASPAYLEALHSPARLGQSVATDSSFIKAILVPFRGNIIEASIFVAYVQNQDVLTKRSGTTVSHYSNRYRTFSATAMYAEISTWANSAQGKASGGLKGLFERFGEAGSLQRIEGGSGRFCDSCVRTVFKVGLAEWWTRESNKRTVQSVLPASIKARTKCKWGNTCFYQENLAHAKEYTHLCARMSDEDAAALPAQAAPVTDPATNVTGAAAVVPFREAFETARQAFEAARPSLPVAAPVITTAPTEVPAPPTRNLLARTEPTVVSDSDHSDINMDGVVLHQEPEQIDGPFAQPNEGNGSNTAVVEPHLAASNEQDQQEEDDSLQVDTAIEAATDAAPPVSGLPIGPNETHPDEGEDW